MTLGTMRLESYLHLPPEQHVPQQHCALVEEGRVAFACTSSKAHSLPIFRCRVEELWFCLWEVTSSQDIFQNHTYALFTNSWGIGELFHWLHPSIPCSATAQLSILAAKCPSFFLPWLINLAIFPAPEPWISTVNHSWSSTDLSLFFLALWVLWASWCLFATVPVWNKDGDGWWSLSIL